MLSVGIEYCLRNLFFDINITMPDLQSSDIRHNMVNDVSAPSGISLT